MFETIVEPSANLMSGMQIAVLAKDLLRGLQHVQSVVERRNTIAILANIKFEVEVGEDNILTLTATDMDITVTTKIRTRCDARGAATLPATMLYEIIRKVDQDTEVLISIPDVNKSSALIQVGTSEFNLPTLPVDAFPVMEQSKATHTFKVNAETLNVLFDSTKHAIANAEARYYLNGLFFHTVEQQGFVLAGVSTDTHRLAKTVLPVDNMTEIPGVIIPKKAVLELIKLLNDYAGEVEVSMSNNRITFLVGTSVLSSRIVEGKFPDYERVIPKTNDRFVEVEREALIKSIDLVLSVSSDKIKAVTMRIKANQITVSASSELNGNAKGVRELPAHYTDTNEIIVNFNARYLLEALSALDSKNVRFAFSNTLTSPVLITPEQEEMHYLQLLMPLEI